jgi:hypothetical protein
MHIVDRVYGEHFIDEPVVGELMLSRPVQRLRGIQQYGLPPVFYPVDGFSRYEHSVGVMLLLRCLGASLTQQVAGLLHDVSHTAFSHVTDSIFGREDGRNAQDERHLGFVLSSELPHIISRHRLDTMRVADLEAHPLLDRDTPDLCADRIDYSLREFSSYMEPTRVRAMLADLAVHEGRIIFTTRESATLFAVNYMMCHMEKWASPEKTVRQHLLAGVIRAALKKGVVSYDDLIGKDDGEVLGMLMGSEEPCVKAGLRMLSGKLPMVEDEELPQLSLQRRSRYVDPEFIHLGRTFRVSEADATYREMIEAHKAIHRKPLRVSILHSLGRA